jgi:hypothetical protein
VAARRHAWATSWSIGVRNWVIVLWPSTTRILIGRLGWSTVTAIATPLWIETRRCVRTDQRERTTNLYQ